MEHAMCRVQARAAGRGDNGEACTGWSRRRGVGEIQDSSVESQRRSGNGKWECCSATARQPFPLSKPVEATAVKRDQGVACDEELVPSSSGPNFTSLTIISPADQTDGQPPHATCHRPYHTSHASPAMSEPTKKSAMQSLRNWGGMFPSHSPLTCPSPLPYNRHSSLMNHNLTHCQKTRCPPPSWPPSSPPSMRAPSSLCL